MRIFCKIMYLIILIIQNSADLSANFMSSVKGIGHGFEEFGKTIGSGSFWKGIGRGFGAAPTGYVYSFTVDNDTDQNINVGIQEYASFMGAYFPKSHGWSQTTLQPFQQSYSIKQKEYYFEMKIMLGSGSSGGGMPYSSDGALYVQDCIQLPKDEHSTKMNYFHVYMGKTLQNGNYVHTPMAEYLGYADPANPKDKNASVKKVDSLTNDPALVVYNSTNQNLLVGYSSQMAAKSLKQSNCDVFLTTIPANSFVLHSPIVINTFDIATLYGAKAQGPTSSLPLGTLGVFESNADEATELYALPSTVFDGQTYTLEIYQDIGQKRKIGLQALQSAHDSPSGNVRDLTPVTGVFWHESVKQLGKKSKNMIDLPGNVWLVASTSKGMIKTKVAVGESLAFTFTRPELDNQTWIYFVYVDEKDSVKEEAFIDKFAKGEIGADVLAKYNQQSLKQFNQAKEELSQIVTFKMGSKVKSSSTVQVPESLLIAAIQGALNIHGGEIIDNDLGVNGFLLGADVFLPEGTGSSNKFYYQLSPSQKNGDTIIKSTVQNLYTMGVMKAPTGMPTPTVYNGFGKSKDADISSQVITEQKTTSSIAEKKSTVKITKNSRVRL